MMLPKNSKPGFIQKIAQALGLRRPPSNPLPKGLTDKDQADDKSWAPGDMAECVNPAGQWVIPVSGGCIPALGPKPGEVRVVRAVTISEHPTRGQVLFLTFARYPGDYEAACFRKLQPTADKAGAADAEFLRDFTDRLKPARIPARVPQRTPEEVA